MSGVEWQAADIEAPNGDGTNNTTVVAYAATTSAAAEAIPDGWAGKFVRLKGDGGDTNFFFSASSAAAVDNTVAATAAGKQDPKLGYLLKDGVAEDFRIPSTSKYLCYQGNASFTLWMLLTNKADP